jgi:type II secretory pathway predicted ATPase ExeA
MYEAYWQLAAKPFEDASDTRFFFPGEAYQSALLKLRYAIESRRGAALLSGPSGCGKTLLVEALLRQLPDSCRPLVHLVFPQMPAEQFLAYLAEELTGSQDAAARTADQCVRTIQGALTANAAAGRHAVFVIDEAQVLRGTGTFETLRLLLNFQHEGRSCLTLLLIGQTSLVPVLARLSDLDSRLGVKCLLRAFTPEETAGYVNHRLAAAGARRPLFDAPALASLFELSQGNARRINRLCDLALLVGYAEERPQIGRLQIEAVADELLAVAE